MTNEEHVIPKERISSLWPPSPSHIPPQKIPILEVLGKGYVAPVTPQRKKAVPKGQPLQQKVSSVVQATWTEPM